jgi:hypothetical protein
MLAVRIRSNDASPLSSHATASPSMMHDRERRPVSDPPPLKWSDLRYVFDIKEDCNGKEAIQA